MKKYLVYRTEKGNLTYFKHGEPVYTVRTQSDLGAQEAIRMLKQAEKQNKKQNDEQV